MAMDDHGSCRLARQVGLAATILILHQRLLSVLIKNMHGTCPVLETGWEGGVYLLAGWLTLLHAVATAYRDGLCYSCRL